MESNVQVYTAYVPHGINSKYFKPLTENDPEYQDYLNFRAAFLANTPSDFVVFWNNRNVRRKQPGDVVLAFKEFTELVKNVNPHAKVTLLMHTAMRDENGTDLVAVCDTLAPECNVVFSEGHISTKELNFYYNLADVTLNIASNEGFGLSGAESLMAGTPIVNNVTGGLQDQCRFEDENGNWINFDSNFTSNHAGTYRKHAVWAKPVFPSVRSLQGSIPTPYIFDDRCRYEDVAAALFEWYQTDPTTRKEAGLAAREWMTGPESGMSSEVMCSKFKQHITALLDNWTPSRRFTFEKVQSKKPVTIWTTGITPNSLNTLQHDL